MRKDNSAIQCEREESARVYERRDDREARQEVQGKEQEI